MMTSKTFFFRLAQGTIEVMVYGNEGPLIIFCHGFPGRFKHNDIAEYTAEHGCTVWLIKYRGVDGSDGEFSFTNAIEDVESVLRHSQTMGYAEIGLFGYSAGAYYSLSAAANAKCIRAICLLSPVFDMVRAARTDFENIVNLMLSADKYLRISSFSELVASYAEAWHTHNSSVSVQKIKEIPLLVIEGGDVEKGDPHQSDLLVDVAGKTAELRILNDSGHYFDDHLSRIQLKKWVSDFFLLNLTYDQNHWREGRLVFRSYSYGDEVMEQDRMHIAHCFDKVADAVWNKDPHYWRNNPHLFSHDYGFVLAFEIETGHPAGFVVYKRYQIRESRVIYVEGINFKPEFQKRGYFLELCKRTINNQLVASAGEAVYLAARTRHPGVLSILQKLCTTIIPGSDAPADFLSMAMSIAQFIYPDSVLESPSMIMRNVYSQFNYKDEPSQEGIKWRFNQIFQSLGPHDAFFIVGKVKQGERLVSA